MSDRSAMRRTGIVATTAWSWYGAAVAVITGPTAGTFSQAHCRAN